MTEHPGGGTARQTPLHPAGRRGALRQAAALLTLWVACAGLGALGCGRETVSPAAGGNAAEGAGAAGAAAAVRYELRGEVTAVPDPDRPRSALVIRHEAVDDFADIDGDVVGMDAMTMPFPTAPGVSLDGIEPGDRVSFTLEVAWDDDPPYRITRLEELPAETPLTFRRARPGAAD
jgi:Cu/Ag efflux protein CusF